MLKKFSLILISVFLLVSFFVLPQISKAQEVSWPLKEKEVENLLDIIRKEPLTKANFELFNDSLSQLYSDYPRKTGAVVLVKQAILKEQLDYWFKEIPKELSIKFLKTALEIGITIATKGSYGAYDILNQLEKITVEKANEYALNWFLQNEIKIGSGEASYIFPSYKGNTQKLDIQYIIVYSPSNQIQGKIVAEFYSKDAIEPPEGRGGLGSPANRADWLESTCWPRDRWVDPNNDGKLEPFIVRVKGDVKRNDWNQFIWDKTKPEPIVEIDFDKLVPEIENSDIILEQGETGMKQEFLKEKIIKPLVEKFIKVKDTTANLIEGIKDYIYSLSFGAQITEETQLFSLLLPDFLEEEITKLTEEVLSLEKIKEALEEKMVLEGVSEKIELTLDELIERFDDILEEAEILLAQVENFLAKENQIIKGNGVIEEKVAEEKIEEEIEDEEEIEEVYKEEQKAIPKQEIVFCSVSNYQIPARNKVIFNEIAWMGTVISSNDEWIELKNISSNSVNLNGWQIFDKDKQIKIVFENINLAPGRFLLLERGDDDSVPNIPADLIYTGTLNNTNETFYLFDKNCQLQDKVEANPNWPAGSNSSKKTMERKTNLTWQTSSNTGGTPKAEDSPGEIQYAGGGISPSTQSQPQISLSYLQNSPVNKEIEVILSLLNLKNASYDVKISIENGTTTLSEIFNEKINDWQSSYKYVTSTFSGTSFSGNFTLRIKESENSFRGETDIIGKIRETGKSSSYSEFNGKINIIDPEQEQNQPPAQESYSLLDVVINEVAWMGTKADYNDEWIELYNNTNKEINLNGWTINWGETTSTHSISLTGSIPIYGFYLLERTASTTISNIEENQIYTGALRNTKISGGKYSGEKLELLSPNSELIDIIDCSEEWFAGDNDTKHTMERINPRISGNNPENWADNNGETINGLDAGGNPILGTPKAKNSVFSTSPPNPVSDFGIDEENSKYNTVVLTWSTTTDLDSPEQDISYIIYYSKSGEITETNIASSDSTSTTSNTITIFELSYNSTYYFGIKAFDGENYSILATTTPYCTPLAPITDLNAGTSAIRKAIDLFWTAPGAESYLIKYAEKEIVENPTSTEKISWEEATLIENLIVPKVAGEIEGFTIENLIPDKTYYFAIKSINQANATSEISHSPKAKAIPGFQDNGDGTITDLYTGLIWVKDGAGTEANNGQPLSWDGAGEFCNNLVLCNDGIFVVTSTPSTSTCSGNGGIKYDDWRLPSFKEFASIIHYSKSAPVIDQNYFPNTTSTNYWTSSYKFHPASGCAGNVCAYPASWDIEIVDFNNGSISITSNTNAPYYLRPVRGPDPGMPNILSSTGMDEENPKACTLGYLDNEDGTIKDNCTGLVWVKGGTTALIGTESNYPLSPRPKTISWENAVYFCGNLNLAGYNDWRLPNILELIITASTNYQIFPWQSGYSGYYWSFTSADTEAWEMGNGYNFGRVQLSPKTSSFYIQCLRNIED